MLKNIDHINIVVSNLETTVAFFTSLGFSVTAQGHLEGDWISSIVGLSNVNAHYVQLSLPGSQTNIELMQYHQPKPGIDPNMGIANQMGYRHLAFEVDDIERVINQLKTDHIEFLSDIQVYQATNKKLVYFRGPDNILLELAEYGQ